MNKTEEVSTSYMPPKRTRRPDTLENKENTEKEKSVILPNDPKRKPSEAIKNLYAETQHICESFFHG